MSYYNKKSDGEFELCVGSDVDVARTYEQRRFDRNARTRRLNEWEKGMVEHALALSGTDSHVLDVPCGSGRFFDILRAARELTMVDVSEGMLGAARERAEGHPNIHALQGDIRNLPLADEAVDLTVCMRLFHHFPTDELRSAALKEIARVTRRYAAVSFYNRASWPYWRRALRLRHIERSYISVNHMTRLAQPFGLKLHERHPSVNIMQQQTVLIFAKS